MIDWLLEHDLLPDRLIRFGIRRLLAQRIREETRETPEARRAHLAAFVRDLRQRPIAEDTRAANEQHYEVPTAFFRLCLGPRLKYSCCLYEQAADTLAEAEERMLALTAARAARRRADHP